MSSPPTVGRVVHYVAAEDYMTSEKVCWAAIVTETRADGVLGLAVFSSLQLFFELEVEYSAEHTEGTWHWPEALPNWPVKGPEEPEEGET